VTDDFTHTLGRVLVVDDVDLVLRSLVRNLRRVGFETHGAHSAPEAMAILEHHPIEVALVDFKLTGQAVSGPELMERIRRDYPTVELIAITGYGSTSTANEVLKHCRSIFSKPVSDQERLFREVRQAAEKARAFADSRRFMDRLRQQVGSDGRFGMVGASPVIENVRTKIAMMADKTDAVLVLGETGVGKELVAAALHTASRRSSDPYVHTSCSSHNADMIYTELFGSEKGGFGGLQDKAGLFERTAKGTLFLDEIGDSSLKVQRDLLRVLNDGTYRRVNSQRLRHFQGRLVTATNRDLDRAVADGTMREDFLARIKVHVIQIPPLRARLDDIQALCYHFLALFNEEDGTTFEHITLDALDKLRSYHWPKNVRGLRACLRRSVLFARDRYVVDIDDIRLPHEPDPIDELTGGWVMPDLDQPTKPAPQSPTSPAPSPAATTRQPPPRSSEQKGPQLRRLTIDMAELCELPWQEARDEVTSQLRRVYYLRQMARADGVKAQAARLSGQKASNFKAALKPLGISDEELELAKAALEDEDSHDH